MTFISKEELDNLKLLPLEEYANFPLLYNKEIKEIFSNIFPKLITTIENFPKKEETKVSVEGINRLERNLENEYIQALEMDIEMLRNFYNHRTKVIIEVPWYKRFFFWLKGK